VSARTRPTGLSGRNIGGVTIEVGQANRENTGRIPRASRKDIFYQSFRDWNVQGDPETPEVLQDNPQIDGQSQVPYDMQRGWGY